MRLTLVLLLAASPLRAAVTLKAARPVLSGPKVVAPFKAGPQVRVFPAPGLGGTLPLLTPSSSPVPKVGAPLPALTEKLAPLAEQAGAYTAELGKAPGAEDSALLSTLQFSLLTGENQGVPPVPADGSARSPEPQDPKKNVRLMRYGTAVNKLGAETVKLGVPILALQTMGSATSVALLAVAYGLAQALTGSLSGWLTDRFPASKVLAGAVAFQVVLISALLGASAAGFFTPLLLFPVYGLFGAAQGVMETTRRVVPPLVLGSEPKALEKYNGSLHIYYQVAGVAGAILAGVMMGLIGPLKAMLVMPPMFLASAWLFSRVKHGFAKPEKRAGAAGGFLKDLAAGAKTIVKTPALRWIGVAMVLPQVVHRVFEDLLLPVFAKGVLGAPNQAAYMLAASNLGELVGAAALLKFTESKPPWVKWSALGLLTVWALSFSSSLPLLLPIILAFSATWAAADLSLLSDLQARLDSKELPRVLSVLLAAAIIIGTAVSLLMGRFLDATSIGTAFLWINVAFTALAAVVYAAYRKLSR